MKKIFGFTFNIVFRYSFSVCYLHHAYVKSKNLAS